MQFNLANLASIDVEEFIKVFVLVILGFILLFAWVPIGVFFLIWAVAKFLKGRAQSYCYYFLSSPFILMAVLSFLGALIEGEVSILFFSLISGIPGFYLFSHARNLGKMVALRKCYIDPVVNQGITSIDNIASVTNKHEKDVMADLRYMINEGLFPGASLDETKKVIVLERYKRYIDLIENHGVTLINDIASKTQIHSENVMADLRNMINKGFFPSAYLDETKRTIVWGSPSVASAPSTVQVQQTPREKVIACPSCGANNKIMSGKVTECQYCGALIQ